MNNPLKILTIIIVIYYLYFASIIRILTAEECKEAQRIEKGEVAPCSGDLVPKRITSSLIASVSACKEEVSLEQQTCLKKIDAQKKYYVDMLDVTRKSYEEKINAILGNNKNSWFSENPGVVFLFGFVSGGLIVSSMGIVLYNAFK